MTDFLAKHGRPWGWDDEEVADEPYIHIYSDDGAVATLHYRSADEAQEYADFAAFVVDLVNKGAL